MTRKNYQLVIPNPGSCGMGDTLLSLLSSRTRDDLIYVLPKQAAHLAPLFWDIAPVLVRDDVDVEKHPPGPGLVWMRLFDEELAWANEKVNGLRKPVAVVVNCAAKWAHVRECTKERWEMVVDKLRISGWTPIQFGVSEHVTVLDGIPRWLDYSVRKLAALYAAIGTYVGVDTGDRHLATAVGARVFVAHPDEHTDYSHKFWHYPHPNVRYYNFRDMERMVQEV